VVGGVLDELDGVGDHLLAGGVELLLDVAVAGGNDEVDAVDAAVHGEVDVPPDAAGEARHPGVQPEVGDPRDGRPLAGAGAGAAGLDDRDARRVQPAGDVDLLVGRQRDARRLLAVPQRRVQNPYLAAVERGAGRVCAEGTPRLRSGRTVEFLDQPPRGDFLYPR
jgi:hypothetical protein